MTPWSPCLVPQLTFLLRPIHLCFGCSGGQQQLQQEAMQHRTVAVQVPEGRMTTTPPTPVLMHPRQNAASRSLQEELLRTQLRMGNIIYGKGDSGLVAHATLAGQAVVVKLYGPELDALEAYCTEFDAYSQLADLQGDVLPVLLAAGRPCPQVEDGVFAIAMRLVPGRTLRSMRGSIGVREAAAAMDALRQLHRRVPGFLHGDVRLSNVVLLPGGREEGEGRERKGEGPPQCVVLDLGAARWGGTEEEQEKVRQMAMEMGLDPGEERAWRVGTA